MEASARQPGVSSTYPQEAGRASTEYPVCIADRCLAPCRRTRSTGRCGGSCALDVVVEAFYDVSGAGFLQVLCFDSQDVVFELLLRTK